MVEEYYGRVLSTSKDLKTSACTTASRPSQEKRRKLDKVPSPVSAKYYGCGSPLPDGGLEGLTVLDLGSGSGRDCYVASQMVGAKGTVIGVDFTEEQLSVARQHADKFCVETLGYPKTNMRFLKGYIEDLVAAGVEPNSVDFIMSNCVVNLSPDKKAVLQSMFNVLRVGGEVSFSDVYCNRRLPASVREHQVLWGECIAGAMYINDLMRLCHEIGFTDPRVVSRAPIVITDPELSAIVGESVFESVTIRLFKLAPGSLETLCEDYGQYAVYLGIIPGNQHSYLLDCNHKFLANKPALVCGNTAAMLRESVWLSKHFKVVGDRATHYGVFAGCGGKPDSSEVSRGVMDCEEDCEC
jgi:arsenite methyltransferase